MIMLNMADPGRSDIRVTLTISLYAFGLKQTSISLLFKAFGFEIRFSSSEKLF